MSASDKIRAVHLDMLEKTENSLSEDVDEDCIGGLGGEVWRTTSPQVLIDMAFALSVIPDL